MKTQDSMMTKDISSVPAHAQRFPFSPRPFAEPAASEVTTAAATSPHYSLQNISFAIQPKLTIGQPNDKYEQEADRVAEQVVQRINSPQFSATGLNNPDPNTARNGKPKLQLKPILQRRSAIEGDATPDLESSINRARGGGQTLDPGLQEKMGRAMGADFSRVKVHTDAQSDQLNRSIQAKAFTTGQDVFFRQGAYDPGSKGGQELIAHELTHVVQQNGRGIQRKNKNRCVGETNEDKYKHEADREENKIVQQINSPDALSPQGWSVIRRTREPSNAAVTGKVKLTKEDKDHLERLKKTPNILKFNFAGSGEERWKSHSAEKNVNSNKKQMESVTHQSGGKKYSKENHTLEKEKIVFEYAGPLVAGGTSDSGKNSTLNNLEDAKEECTKYMDKFMAFRARVDQFHDVSDVRPVQINIKGFSRGAATASVLAHWIKNKHSRTLAQVDLLLIDPVHGTSILGIGGGLMPSQQDVSNVYDEAHPDTSGTTYLMPIRSGYPLDSFTPQKIRGYQRLIIAYGKGSKHSFGLGESNEATLQYKDTPVKGMKLSTLPKGLFVVNAENMNIVQVKDMKEWREKYMNSIFDKVDKTERRHDVIEAAFDVLREYFPS